MTTLLPCVCSILTFRCGSILTLQFGLLTFRYLDFSISLLCPLCQNCYLLRFFTNDTQPPMHWKRISRIELFVKISTSKSHKDRVRVLYRCRYYDMDDLGCDWRLRGNITDEGDIEVTVLELGHTCIIPLACRSVAATQEWLQVNIPNVQVGESL